eukprot:SAG31_NODE_2962_length_4846_cov_3.429956_4_plen_79_part_00
MLRGIFYESVDASAVGAADVHPGADTELQSSEDNYKRKRKEDVATSACAEVCTEQKKRRKKSKAKKARKPSQPNKIEL